MRYFWCTQGWLQDDFRSLSKGKIKNISRIYWSSKWKNVKNIEAQHFLLEFCVTHKTSSLTLHICSNEISLLYAYYEKRYFSYYEKQYSWKRYFLSSFVKCGQRRLPLCATKRTAHEWSRLMGYVVICIISADDQCVNNEVVLSKSIIKEIMDGCLFLTDAV